MVTDYSSFTAEAFALDEFFQDWVLRPSAASDRFWEQWLQAFPQRKEEVDAARQLLRQIRFREDTASVEQARKSLSRSLQMIEESESVMPLLQRSHRAKLTRMYRIAAIVCGLVLVGAVLWYSYGSARTTASTRFAETKTVVLPDQSEVTLNANSSISYASHWGRSGAREIWLQGEAFFKVRHKHHDGLPIKESDRFLVHVEGMDVEVLGTSFNVKSRHHADDVVLEAGSVKLHFADGRRPDLLMLPGQKIVYDALNGSLSRSATDPAVQTAWRTGKMILEDVSVNDIITFIGDNYGYQVILEDPATGKKKMEGTILLDNFKDILFVLSTTLNVNIETRDSVLVFHANRP